MSNEQIIYNTSISAGLSPAMANLMVSQAKFESGNFTNNAFKNNLNAFGYKYYSGSDWQIGKGNTSTEGDPYAKYNSLADSTNEVVSWWKRRESKGQLPNSWKLSDLNTAERYTYALKHNTYAPYFGGSENEYSAGLKKYLSAIVDVVKENPVKSSIGLFFILGITSLLIYKYYYR